MVCLSPHIGVVIIYCTIIHVSSSCAWSGKKGVHNWLNYCKFCFAFTIGMSMGGMRPLMRVLDWRQAVDARIDDRLYCAYTFLHPALSSFAISLFYPLVVDLLSLTWWLCKWLVRSCSEFYSHALYVDVILSQVSILILLVVELCLEILWDMPWIKSKLINA